MAELSHSDGDSGRTHLDCQAVWIEKVWGISKGNFEVLPSVRVVPEKSRRGGRLAMHVGGTVSAWMLPCDKRRVGLRRQRLRASSWV